MDINDAGKKRNKYNLDANHEGWRTEEKDAQRGWMNADGWCTEEFDSISADIQSLAAAVSSSSSSAEETEASLPVTSSNSTSSSQNENSDISVISLDESNDDIQVISQNNLIFLEEEVVQGTTSHKPTAKKSTGPRPRPLISRKNSKDQIYHNLKQSLIQVKSQLGAISSKNDSIQQVSHGVLETFSPNYEKLDKSFELTKNQLNEEDSDELCDTTSICKILSVSSMAQSNENDVTSTKSMSCKSKDVQLKQNKTLTLESNVSVNEDCVVIFDDFEITQEHGKSLGFSIGGQEDNCISVSESNEKSSLPTVQTLKESDDIDVIDIDELLIEPISEDNILEEFIDVEDMLIEIDNRKEETNEVVPTFHEDKTNKQSMITNETFQKTRSEFPSPKLVQSNNIFSGKSKNDFLHKPLKKSNSHSLNKRIHHGRIQKLKTRIKENKKKSRSSKSLLKIAATADSSSMLPTSPKSVSSTGKSSPTVNSNSECKENQDLKIEEIYKKISSVKNLTLSTLRDHLTDDDIRALGGEVLEEEQPLGFPRGLEPEIILGVHVEEKGCFFIIKWVGSCQADLVTAEEAKIHCPQLVIAFYENQYRKTCLQ